MRKIMRGARARRSPLRLLRSVRLRRAMRLLALGATLSALGACATHDEIAMADCLSWGTQPGTTAYAECMSTRLSALEAQEAAALGALVPRTVTPYPGF